MPFIWLQPRVPWPIQHRSALQLWLHLLLWQVHCQRSGQQGVGKDEQDAPIMQGLLSLGAVCDTGPLLSAASLRRRLCHGQCNSGVIASLLNIADAETHKLLAASSHEASRDPVCFLVYLLL